MKRLRYLLLVVTLVSLGSSAQANGYLGKRFSLMYTPAFMVWFRPTRFDLTHTGSLQYTANTRSQLELRYSYFKGNMDYDPHEVIGSSEYSRYDTVSGEAKSHSVAFFVKVFQRKRGFIAPSGSYWSFGIGWLYSYTYFTEKNDVAPVGESVSSYNDGAFYIGRGRQFIFADRIVLDLGCQFGIAGLSAGRTSNDFERRIFFSYLFRVNIGLGFIAF